MSRVVYIAGPYAAETPEGIAENIRRAVALGRYAASCGLAPVVPHVIGAAGVYGDPGEGTGDSRQVALRCALETVRCIAAQGGDLWVIAHDDGTLSSGTALEVDAYIERRSRDGDTGSRYVATWAQWLELGVTP